MDEIESLVADGGYNLVHEVHRVQCHPHYLRYPNHATFGDDPKTWVEDLKAWVAWFQNETMKAA